MKYKVILVDDEDIEREAMAELIPWNDLQMELSDMAWNGIEALEKIRIQVPDLVITDIKMPVMDGIELICKARAEFPNMAFVVLSGYGEYEYTSKAMEQGIRHYILKPCDEEGMIKTLKAVQTELDEKRARQSSATEFQNTLQRALPHAKEQILNALIAMNTLSVSDEILLKKFVQDQGQDCILLIVSSGWEMDQLDRFVIRNILTELIGNGKILMSTSRKREVIFLLPSKLSEDLPMLMDKVHKEFYKYKNQRLRSAVSCPGAVRESCTLYGQARELLRLGEQNSQQEFFSYESGGLQSGTAMVLDYERIQKAETYDRLLFELYVSYIKMQISGFDADAIRGAFSYMLEVCYGEDGTKLKKTGNDWDMLEEVLDKAAALQIFEHTGIKEDFRMQEILLSIYKNIQNPEMSLQFLAREILFMNEDYLGRLFFQNMNQKYSVFLLKLRMELAKQILDYCPDIRISELASQIGYAPDGQYFAKVFKKYTGMAPSDYRRGRLEQ